MTIVLMRLLMFAVMSQRVSAQIDMSAYVTRQDLDGVIFTDSLLFEMGARSVVDCALRCVGIKACAFFTYSLSSEKSCRTHKTTMTLKSSTVQAIGAKAYAFKGAPCPLSRGYRQESTSGLCFKLWPMKAKFFTAWNVCQDDGGELIMLDTEVKILGMRKALPTIFSPFLVGIFRPSATFDNPDQGKELLWVRTGQPVVDAESSKYIIHIGPKATTCGLFSIPNNNISFGFIGIEYHVGNFEFICEIFQSM